MTLLIGAGEAVLAGLLLAAVAYLAVAVAYRRRRKARLPPRRGAIQVLPPMPSRPLNGNHHEQEEREAYGLSVLTSAHRDYGDEQPGLND